ncbi:uncharacterized protein N7500_008389 [Penicillium coprophilum]|uniref:uncharacterized protein n=1 Tax=Penicillium coprophilum TaxID=36646 RepID=UPI002390C589|nr:uncharacterized protein N7500_008389 [Penicillium coprophilum]KAJ5158738.1 hypothetical protein N7500_008389 [Penicillium coprophilum]
MDPSEAQSPPSVQLGTTALNSARSVRQDAVALVASSSVQQASMTMNSPTVQSAPSDAPTEPSPGQSHYISLFGGSSPPETPRLGGSPYFAAGLASTPSTLERHSFGNLDRSSSAHSDETQSGQVSGNLLYFAREPSLPYELWEAIFYATLSSDSREENDFEYGDIFENPATKKTLSTFRLVNRIWNSIASPLMFRCLQAVVGYSAGQPLDSILKISASPYAIYVRDVRFGFVGAWLPGLDYDRYIDDLASGALPILVSRFPNIQTLRMQSPSVVDTFSEDGQIKPPMLAKMTNALVHTLRFVPVPKLRCLHFSLPTTAEFARFFELNSYATDFTKVFAQIEELHININDNTGPDGRRDPKWPRSMVKAKYPLDRFAPYLVQLISYAKKIQVLTLNAQTWFDVSDLEPENLSELKSFRLEGVRIRDETLRNIFHQARNTLLRIELVHVRLMTGTWEKVFGSPILAPWHLIWLRIDGCGYSMMGTSAHHVGFSFTHFPTALWTLHGRDWLALTRWRSVVNANRLVKGLRTCPHSHFPAVAALIHNP